MPHFSRARTSIWTRLILIPASLLVLGIASAIVVTLYDARDRIDSEIASGANIGSRLIAYALQHIDASADPDAALMRLQQELSAVRHVRVAYEEGPSRPQTNHMGSAKPSPVPDWFLRLFKPEKLIKSYPVTVRGERRGDLIMMTKPSDEVAEIWQDLVFMTTLLGVISLSIVTLIVLTARQALKPLSDVADGLDRLQHGKFDRLDEIRVIELQQIGEQFNRLAHSLSRTEADNRLLIEQLMSIQETERRELAHELHDEFGATLFGIRAAAATIVADVSSDEAASRLREVIGRAEAISAMADVIQKLNYRILERIRPVTLHEAGLFTATQDLIDQ